MAAAPPARIVPPVSQMGAGPQTGPGGTQAGAAGLQTAASVSPQASGEDTDRALVVSARHAEDGAETRFSPRVLRLPVELDIVVPVREFRVRNLLALSPGQLVLSQWGSGNDLPLAAGAVSLAWVEFEVLESKLAARITRVA